MQPEGLTCHGWKNVVPDYLKNPPSLRPILNAIACEFVPFDDPPKKKERARYLLPRLPAAPVLTDEFVAEHCIVIRSKLGHYAFALRGNRQQITRWAAEYAVACRKLFKTIRKGAVLN